MPFQITPQHEAIFSAFDRGETNIIIESVAGSGKSSTCEQLMRRIPERRDPLDLLCVSGVYLAFNKTTAEEFKSRVPRHLQSSTFHSLGFRALKNVLPERGRSTRVEGRKVSKLVWDSGCPQADVIPICRLVGLLKSVPPSGAEGHDGTSVAAAALAELHEISFSDESAAFRIATSVLTKSDADLKTIDFDDMLRLPVLLDAPFDTQDYVFVDEAQDTNEIQLEILTRLAKLPKQITDSFFSDNRPFLVHLKEHLTPAHPNSPTRFVFVGDPWQAIYGFRGANTDSMSRIAARFSCKSFPLSVSYRCPKAVVREAQKYMKETTV